MLQLVVGFPKELEHRLEKEVRVYQMLDSLGILYERIDHEPLDTMEACKAVDGLLDATICKNLFLRNAQKNKFYLLLMPGKKKFKTKEISKQIQSARLSFAEGEYMELYLDCTPGSASVLGLMNDKEHQVQLLIDEEVLMGEYIGCHPCINTSSLKIKTKDLMEVILPKLHHEAIVVSLTGEE